MNKKNWIFNLLLLSGLMFCGSVSAITIGFSPDSESVLVGESFDVDVYVSGLSAAGDVVSAFDLDVAYDESLLSATGVQFTDNLGMTSFFEAFVFSDLTLPGIVNFAELSLLPDAELLSLQPDDSVLIASLSFTAIADGISELFFVPDSVFGIDVKGNNADILAFDSVNIASVTISAAAVPAPGTLLLMLGGLLGAVAQKRSFLHTHKRFDFLFYSNPAQSSDKI